MLWAVTPLLVLLLGALLAALLPEDVLWVNAAKAVLLTALRWVPLGWGVWAVWALRRGAPRLPALALGLGGLALTGLPPLDRAEGEGLVLVSANVQAYADGAERLEQALSALGPDVVLTIEQRGERLPGMRRVVHNYDRDLPRPSHGAAMYCREGLDCVGWISGELGPPGCSMPLGLLRVDQRFCVVSMHAPPPVPLCAEGLHPYLEGLAGHLQEGRVAEAWGPCAAGDPALVLGDLNYVPGSQAYRTLRARGLSDPLLARGVWAASWPAGGGWWDLPFFRLDHALVGALEVEGVRLHRLPDSDHKAIRLRVR